MSVETGTPSAPATPAAAAVASPTATPTATSTSTPAAGGQTPAQPHTVTIPLEQLQAFTAVQARLTQMEADQRQRDEASRAEQVKLLTARGEVEKAMQIQQEESRKALEIERVARATNEERAKRYAKTSELKSTLSKYPLVPAAVDQLASLFERELQVDASGDNYVVRTPQFQTCADFVAAQLASGDYAHFLRASNPNGGTAGGGSSGAASTPTPSATATQEPPPKNFGEAIVRQMQQVAKEQPSDPRLNPAAAMGLNRRSMVRNA